MTQRLETEIVARNNASRVYNKVTGDTRRLRKEMNAAGLASKRFSQNLGGSTWKRQVQQAGMQVSDFSVQVAGGQSAILAFTQNAPQFLQNFGAIGGVIAAAVTILGTFAYAASRAGEAVLSFQEQVEVTTGSVDDFVTMLRDSSDEADGAFKVATAGLESTARTAIDQMRIVRAEAEKETQKLFASMRKEATRGNFFTNFFTNELEELGQTLDVGWFDRVVAQMGGSSGQGPALRAMKSALDGVVNAEGVKEQYEAVLVLRSALDGIAGDYSTMGDSARGFFEQLVQATAEVEKMRAAQLALMVPQDAHIQKWSEIQALIEAGNARVSLMGKVLSDEALAETIKIFEAWKDTTGSVSASNQALKAGYTLYYQSRVEASKLASVDITSGVDAAAVAAAKLAGKLGISLDLATKIQALSGKSAAENAFDAKVRTGVLPPQAAGDFNAKGGPRPFDLQEYMSDVEKRLAGLNSAGGAGGGGGGGRAPQLNPNDAIVRMLGYDPKKIMKDQVDYIADSFTSMQQTVSQSMMSGFKGLLAGTKSLGEAVRDILSSILDSIIDILMTPVFNSIAGSLAGGILGAGGPITAMGGSIVPSFEGGGSTGSRPRAGGIDGRGGFLGILHGNESIDDHTKGQGTAPVTINFNVQATDVDSFRRSQRQIERDLVGAVRRGGM